VRRYVGRVSGPLMDRIDIHLNVPPVPFDSLEGHGPGEASGVVRERVAAARALQSDRFRDDPRLFANAHMGGAEVRRWCGAPPDVGRLLRHAVDRTGLSARAYHRVLKVARTIADLDASEGIRLEHAAEAVQYRVLDRGEPRRG